LCNAQEGTTCGGNLCESEKKAALRWLPVKEKKEIRVDTKTQKMESQYQKTYQIFALQTNKQTNKQKNPK
jgi:hypothetical protein